jgi:hypothetical protein
MKNFTLLVLLTIISFSASAQLTFDWEAQYISEGNNIKAMNVADDNTAILAGYGRTFKVSPDQGLTWNDVPLLDPEFDFGDVSINSSGLGYALAGDVKVIDNPTSGEPDVYADGVLLKTIDFGATWTVVDVTSIGSEEGPEENPNEVGCYATHFRAVEVLEDNTVFLGAEWYFYESASDVKVSQRGVLKSTDGEIWTAVVDNGYYPMAIEAATSSVYYGGLNNLFRAEAGSETVTDIYTALTDAAGDLTVFINDFEIVSEDLVYVVTSTNGIYVTEDQGSSFAKLANGAPTGANDMLV